MLKHAAHGIHLNKNRRKKLSQSMIKKRRIVKEVSSVHPCRLLMFSRTENQREIYFFVFFLIFTRSKIHFYFRCMLCF